MDVYEELKGETRRARYTYILQRRENGVSERLCVVYGGGGRVDAMYIILLHESAGAEDYVPLQFIHPGVP